jgi:putative DNA primase/helicase
MTPTAFQFYADRNPGIGLALVCGKVSGNLEMLEIEGRAADFDSLDKIRSAAEAHNVLDVWDDFNDYGYCEVTPSGGMHLLYRLPDDRPVPGNTKLAQNAARECLAETRGEGGYVVVAPTAGRVHKTGLGWTCVSGRVGELPSLTWEARDALHAAIREALDETPPPVLPAPTPFTYTGDIARPGDDFNANADWAGILEPHGWTVSHTAGAETFWVRPGKEKRDGHSASTGYVAGADRLYVWSSSTPFDTETPYNKFAAYAVLNHNGDFAAATRDLNRQGFGEQRRQAPPKQQWEAFVPQAGSSNVDSPKKDRRESFTDVGTANRFVREQGTKHLYVKGAKGDGEWLFYDGAIWRSDETGARVADDLEDLVDRMDDEARPLLDNPDQAEIGKELRRYVKTARSNSGRKGLISTTAAKLAIAPKDLDRNRHLIGLPNGVLDVRTGEVLPPDPAYLITKTLGVAYDPEATAPRTEKFLAEVLPDAGYRDYVARGMGYTLTGEQNQRAFFILHGDPGTGKSQFLELFKRLFGDYATAAADGAFRKKTGGSTGPSAELHALQGARYVFSSESDEDVVFDADVVKRICGGDTMSTRTLFGKPEEWRAECVVWLATNHFPRFPADEEAVWDRVKAVPFDQVFPKTGSRIASISDELFEAEAAGILNLLISWLKAYRERGLSEPDCLVSGVSARQDEVNPVKTFWDELVGTGEMVADENSDTPFTLVYQHFANWYKESWGTYPMGSRRFGHMLRKVVGYDQLAKRNGKTHIPGWSKRGYSGLFGSM